MKMKKKDMVKILIEERGFTPLIERFTKEAIKVVFEKELDPKTFRADEEIQKFMKKEKRPKKSVRQPKSFLIPEQIFTFFPIGAALAKDQFSKEPKTKLSKFVETGNEKELLGVTEEVWTANKGFFEKEFNRFVFNQNFSREFNQSHTKTRWKERKTRSHRSSTTLEKTRLSKNFPHQKIW